MQEAEQQIYLNLVQELLNCTPGQEIDLLKTKPEMVNEKLVDTLLAVAQMFDRQEHQQSKSTAKWLVDFAQYLARQIGLDLRSEEEKRPKTNDYDEQIQFLIEVLRLVGESDGDPQLVYTLLSKKLALLNDRMIDVIKVWTRAKLAESESDAKELLATIIDMLGKLLDGFPLGNKAINIDLTIACQEIFIEVFTVDRHPQDWAKTQYNLAHDYINRMRGDRANNLEKSIACYLLALKVRTKQDLPIDWAMTQSNLASAYKTRILGDKEDNFDKSISCSISALEVITKESLPMDWARIYYNLASIYNERVSGIESDNIEKSILYAASVLDVITKENLPTQWQSIQCILGNSYSNRTEENRVDNIEKSIICYNSALEVLTKEDSPVNWATTYSNLALAYSSRIKGYRDDNLEKVIDCVTLALEIQTKENSPIDWARNQSNLADAYSESNKGNRINNLENSIDCYTSCLDIYTKEDLPRQWATIQNDIAVTYLDRIKGDTRENIEKSIACLQLALEIRTKENFPFDWSATQGNLATAYKERVIGDKSENIEMAIAYLTLALSIYTNENFSIDWIKYQNSLATAYYRRIKGDKSDNIEKSIACSNLALKGLVSENLSVNLVNTQNNLASAYDSIIQEDRSKNIELINTQNNLANAYNFRVQGDRLENIEQSIGYYSVALKLTNKEDLPIQWAMIKHNLGWAYYSRIKGDKKSNLEQSIDCYISALEIYKKEGSPINCLRTATVLGYLYFDLGNWQQAIDSYILAITAVELSRSWANSEQRKQEIIEQAIQVYFNLVQCCINTQQYDKALEYAERSKSRNLVELLATRDLYPKGDIPADILSQLDTLRRQVLSEERRISQRSDFGNSIDPGSRGIANQNTTGIDPDRERLFTLKQDLDNLIIDRVQPIDPSFQLTQQVQSIDFATMQSALPNAQTALLTWYISSNQIHTFLVTPFHNQPHVINSTPEQYEALDNLRANYLNSYRTDKQTWRETLPNLLQQISQILNLPEIITKLLQLNSDCNQIILIPHRILHLLPLHALPLNEAGDCLLDLFPGGVSYAPSIQLLKLSQKWHRPALQSLFAIQNPTNDLTYTDVEVPAICDRFQPHVEIVKGKQADKAALSSEGLNQANCVHFSCHGSFNFENPLASALILSGGTTDLDKCLTLGEIFQLDLRQCGLVTLSACETGLTDFRSTGDEYIGLPSGFLYAGSSNVVSSLWAVSDLSTTFLMIKFYQNLKEADSVAIALNQAQKWLRQINKSELLDWITLLNLGSSKKLLVECWTDTLRSMDDDALLFQSPYHWAAFCALG